jgi:hypothetical protein
MNENEGVAVRGGGWPMAGGHATVTLSAAKLKLDVMLHKFQTVGGAPISTDLHCKRKVAGASKES